MNTHCQAIRVELTELLMLDRPLPTPLARHLFTCKDCSAETEGVRRVIRTLERAESPLTASGDPASGDPAPGAPAIGAPDTARRGAGPDGPRRTPARARVRRRAAAAAGALAMAACAVLFATANGGDGTRPATAGVTLSREGRMVSHDWGTEVPVALSGLRPGHTYRLVTGDAGGRQMSAGSLHAGGRGGPMHAHMVTAMAKSRITLLLVEDEHGRTVARAPVSPSGLPDIAG